MKADHQNKRRQAILDMLVRERVVPIRDLLSKFDVSEETVRKDLIAMEAEKILIRRHGSVELASSGSEVTVDIRAAENLKAKERIAAAALDGRRSAMEKGMR